MRAVRRILPPPLAGGAGGNPPIGRRPQIPADRIREWIWVKRENEKTFLLQVGRFFSLHSTFCFTNTSTSNFTSLWTQTRCLEEKHEKECFCHSPAKSYSFRNFPKAPRFVSLIRTRACAPRMQGRISQNSWNWNGDRRKFGSRGCLGGRSLRVRVWISFWKPAGHRAFRAEASSRLSLYLRKHMYRPVRSEKTDNPYLCCSTL